jgi:FkbM family methyltransferase
VEPNPINYQTLQNNIKLNNIRNVVALNFASWDRECALKLFTGHVAGHHSVKMNWKLGWFEVKAKKMDNVLKEYCNGRVNWIKIDVEGAEWEVLCGLKETIKKYKPKIIAEVSYENMDKVKSFMEEQGYGLIKISPAFEGMIYGFFRKYIYFLFLPLSSQESTTLP